MTYKYNSLEHRILAHLSKDDVNSQALAKRLKVRSVGVELFEMSKRGLVRTAGMGFFTITREGLDLYHQLGTIHEQIPALRLKAKLRSELFLRGTYNGEELRDLPARPGAYDYRNHPSVLTGERVWYGRGFSRIKVESSNHQ
jgi:hypothetical protein